MYLANPSLLITDDDRDFRETLREVFEPTGYRTLLACDGEEALRIVRREQIHVALLDMHMPRLTGLETVQRVRELHLDLPCILVSARMDNNLEEAAKRLHVFASLPKPISFRELRQVVSDAMRIAYNWPPSDKPRQI